VLAETVLLILNRFNGLAQATALIEETNLSLSLFACDKAPGPYIPSHGRSVIISRRKFRGNIYTIPTMATDEAMFWNRL
jgi:hypothetical protein